MPDMDPMGEVAEVWERVRTRRDEVNWVLCGLPKKKKRGIKLRILKYGPGGVPQFTGLLKVPSSTPRAAARFPHPWRAQLPLVPRHPPPPPPRAPALRPCVTASGRPIARVVSRVRV